MYIRHKMREREQRKESERKKKEAEAIAAALRTKRIVDNIIMLSIGATTAAGMILTVKLYRQLRRAL